MAKIEVINCEKQETDLLPPTHLELCPKSPFRKVTVLELNLSKRQDNIYCPNTDCPFYRNKQSS